MTAVSLLLILFLASSTAILGLCLLNLRNKFSKQLQAQSEVKGLKQTQPICIVSKSTRHSAEKRKRESDSTSHGGCARDEAPRGNGGVSKGFTARPKNNKKDMFRWKHKQEQDYHLIIEQH